MTPCPGCHVGPDDECEAGCPASTLVRAGWSDQEVNAILNGPVHRELAEAVDAAIERDNRDRTLAGPLLTAEEHELMEAISVVSGKFRALLAPDRSGTALTDWTEVAGKIHDLQGRVLMNAAGRAYPGRYRLLGGRPR